MTENSRKKNSKKSLYSKDFKEHRRSFLKKTTQVAGAAFAVSLTGTLDAIPVSAKIKSSVMKPKANLVFPVISDLHIMKDSDHTLDKFKEMMKQLNEHTPYRDAFVAVGDLTESGYEEEYDRFMSVYNQGKKSGAESMFAIGNHDYWNGLSVKKAQQLFLKKTGMESMYYHKVVKGYHFIILATEDGLTEGTFTEEQIKWLDKQLQVAQEDDDEKPIFVFHHQPIKGTVYGSEWGFDLNRDLFYDTLSKYPRVISFSGHTHYPLDDPRIIHQKDFTAIGTSTGKDLWLESGRIQGDHPEGGDFLNQALIVEVLKNKVIIHRRDIHNNDWTGEPFEIKLLPPEAGHNGFKYTEDRDQIPPHFTGNAMASIDKKKITNTSLTIILTQAKDNLLVHDYRIVAKVEGEEEKEYLAFSEFYKDPVPDPLGITVNGLKPDTIYEFDVYALDAFGNESKDSISTMGKTSDKGPTITMSSDTLSGIHEKVDVKVENIREPLDDWIGLYEEHGEPGQANPSIWWMYTPEVNDGTFTFTYNPSSNAYPDRYKENATYKMVYFYGSGYDAVASQTFTVCKMTIEDLENSLHDLEEAGDIDEEAMRKLTMQVTALKHFEEKGAADKVHKHLEGMLLLINQQKDRDLMTDRAYNILKEKTESLLNQWE